MQSMSFVPQNEKTYRRPLILTQTKKGKMWTLVIVALSQKPTSEALTLACKDFHCVTCNSRHLSANGLNHVSVFPAKAAPITGSIVVLNCRNGHSEVNRKVEISTPCRITISQNFILKFGKCDYAWNMIQRANLGAEGWGVSPQIHEI